MTFPIINKFFLPNFLTKNKSDSPEITEPKFIIEFAKLKYIIYCWWVHLNTTVICIYIVLYIDFTDDAK